MLNPRNEEYPVGLLPKATYIKEVLRHAMYRAHREQIPMNVLKNEGTLYVRDLVESRQFLKPEYKAVFLIARVHASGLVEYGSQDEQLLLTEGGPTYV